MPDQIEKLRIWARDQLTSLKRQREGLDRRIGEFEGFLAILSQSEIAMKGGTLERAASVLRANGNATAETMPGRIAAVLRESTKPMGPVEIAQALVDGGFKYEGRTPLKIMVSTELARQSKKQGHGIRKVGPAQYVVAA